MKLVGASARAVTVLDQWLRYTPGLLNLTGSAGSGKRSVIKALCGDQVRPIRLEGPVTPEVLLNAIARQLGVAPGAPAATITALRQQSNEVREAGFPVLVSIEFAEQVPDATLALIGRLCESLDDQPGIAVALLSEQSLRERIRPLVPPDALIQDVSLVPLSYDETNELVDYLLTQGPWSGDAIASLDRADLFEISQGNPGQILLAVERHRAGLPLSGPVPGRRRVAWVFSVLALVAAGLSLAWVWQWHKDEQVAEVQASDSLQSLAQLEQELARVPEAPPPLSAELLEPNYAQLLPPIEPAELPTLEALAATTLIEVEADLPSAASSPEALLSELSQGQAEIPVRPAPAPEAVVFSDATEQAESTQDVALEQDVQVSEAAPSFGYDEGRILSQAPESITLQVFGTADSAAALAQKTGKFSALDLQIAQVTRDGNPWFIGLVGPFETRAAAEQTAARPPIDNEVWIRSVGSVQAQIKEAANQ